ncbi:hypothetical protein CALVIDRAFT_225556 [Calocera viscosa TUFC12733]|uniref:C2H2-type domain-containing protein n=1 Tax=Calocera viscosa (strain TUFC12733) TaxID=1330018 RepID=A0A167K0T4_CALVF|nr:hypothetical protein CALVIDRAFT_225556 [Calocera viscosa TUFC12733]
MVANSTYSSRQYVCDASVSPGNWCGKRFERRHDLNRHVKVHQGRKDYECNLCGETFAQKNGWDVHKRVHEGLRTHACPESKYWGHGDCDVAPFRDDSSYRRHWQNKHANSPHRFECPKCNFKAARKALLRNHMRDRHNRPLPQWMQDRQPRGAHGIEVPPHIPVTVYDNDIKWLTGTSARSRGRSRSNYSRSARQPSGSPSMRSPSYEGDLTPAVESPSDSDSSLTTPATDLNVPAGHEDPFSLRVPSLPPPSIWSSENEMLSSGVWAPSISALPAAPIMEHPALPNNHGTPPMIMLNDTPIGASFSMMQDYKYTYPALEPFGVLDNGPYTETSSPAASFVFDEPNTMSFWGGLPPDSMGFDPTNVGDASWIDSMIDPSLLGQ